MATPSGSEIHFAEYRELELLLPGSLLECQETPELSDDDAVLAVAAQYVYEEEHAAFRQAMDTAAPTTAEEYDQSQKDILAETPYGRRERLRDELLARNTPKQPDRPTFDDLTAEDAAAEVRKQIKADHDRARADRTVVCEVVGRMAANVSAEQARWELANGAASIPSAYDSPIPDIESVFNSQEFVLTLWHSARNAFARNNGQSMSPADLTRRMKLPDGLAVPVISSLAMDHVIVRDVANNMLSASPLIAPSGFHRRVGRLTERLTRRKV